MASQLSLAAPPVHAPLESRLPTPSARKAAAPADATVCSPDARQHNVLITSRPVPRRLFRADSPGDVICSALVANTLPDGESVLAFCTDKSTGDVASLRDCLLALAELHDWHAVVDISGLPINQHAMGVTDNHSRRRMIADTLHTAELLRQKLAGPLGLDPDRRIARQLDAAIDELYVTCVYHADVQALMKSFSRALKFYYPHGFGGLSPSELKYYEPVLVGVRRNPANSLKDTVRRVVWGRDAVPLRTVRLDGAYSFDLPMPWTETHSVSHLETKATMAGLFRQLPDQVRSYFGGLATDLSTPLGLVLLSGKGSRDTRGEEAEIEAHVHVARSMIGRHHLQSLVVKPHPMGSPAWSGRVIAELEVCLADVDIKVMSQYHQYPVEVVLVPFSIASAGTVISMTLRTIRQIYEVPCYCPESRLLAIWHGANRAAVEEWVAQSRDYYVAV